MPSKLFICLPLKGPQRRRHEPQCELLWPSIRFDLTTPLCRGVRPPTTYFHLSGADLFKALFIRYVMERVFSNKDFIPAARNVYVKNIPVFKDGETKDCPRTSLRDIWHDKYVFNKRRNDVINGVIILIYRFINC